MQNIESIKTNNQAAKSPKEISMLTIQNLSKAYSKSKNLAIDDLSLELKRGEIFGFLGHNGAGKTTTIKTITGILPFEQGSIFIDNYDIKTDTQKAKSSFGYVSDNHIIYDKLTGREYVNFLANVYRVPMGDRKIRVDKMLELFALTDAYDTPIKTYSHGMKQKIHIIGSLIHNPSLWILDEPMTGLDPQSNFELKKLMREHCKQGNTVFFSTHILDVAEKLCDRIGIISKGKLVGVGSIESLRQSKYESLEAFFLDIDNDKSPNNQQEPNSDTTSTIDNTNISPIRPTNLQNSDFVQCPFCKTSMASKAKFCKECGNTLQNQ